MNKETITTTLRLIVAKSADASKEAIAAIRASNADSPITQTRLNRVAELALSDQSCEWSLDERELIAAMLQVEDTRRTRIFPIRFSEQEHAELSRLASEGRTTMADYIRQKIFEIEDCEV